MINDSLATQILESLGVATPKLEEKKEPKAKPEVETPPVEKTEEATEVHVCPLCETKLNGPLDEAKVDAFVNSLVQLDEDEDSEDEPEVEEAKKAKGLPKNLANTFSKGEMSGKKK